jgi:hypothetical protein
MADRPMGLLVAGFDFSPAAEDEFNDWYDTEHVPERARTPGFINCERWIGAEDPRISIATYDLETLAVLQSPAYKAIGGVNLSPWSKRVTGKCGRICRFEAEQTLPGNLAAPKSGANAMLFFAMNPTPEAEKDFNDWYNQEHVPALAAVPGCLAARRFRIVTGASEGNHRYLALYHLTSPEVQTSDAWKKAVDTPWTHRIRPQTRDRLRIVLKRYVRKAN